MDTQTLDHHRVRRWISRNGGEITRSKLRQYRSLRTSWEPIERALQDLIASGEVCEFRNEMEGLERGGGFPATRYRLVKP